MYVFVNVHFTELRKPYNSVHEVFDVKDLVSKEPFENFRIWFEEACNSKNIYEPNAMALATATMYVEVTCYVSLWL
jgi:pyridoxine/pyridoxamine 5'-phosphate oxidase